MGEMIAPGGFYSFFSFFGFFAFLGFSYSADFTKYTGWPQAL